MSQRLGLAPFAVALVALAACSGAGRGNAASSNPAQSSALAAGVSKSVLDKGQLVIATDAAYPPAESIDKTTGKVVGFEPDLMNAMAKKLGLTVKYVNLDFGGLLTGVSAGRYDAAMSSISDTKLREKTVDFVDYASVGNGLLLQGGNPKGIQGMSDLCGKRLSSEPGSVATEYATAESRRCLAAGKQPIAILQFPSAAQAQLQLSAGRVDAIVHDFPLAQYIANNSGGKFSVASKQFLPGPSGIAVSKRNTATSQALLYALKAIMSDGTYAKILQKWNLNDIAINSAGVNQAVN